MKHLRIKQHDVWSDTKWSCMFDLSWMDHPKFTINIYIPEAKDHFKFKRKNTSYHGTK